MCDPAMQYQALGLDELYQEYLEAREEASHE